MPVFNRPDSPYALVRRLIVLTDTHCHLDSGAFDADRSAVIERALSAGVIRMLVPGLSIQSSTDCVRLASENPAIFAAVGVHPTDEGPFGADSLQRLRELAALPKVVAIGEVGLDYYWVHGPDEQARQRETLRAQLRLAAERHRPVILHCREKGDAESGACIDDLLGILTDWLHETDPQPAHPGVLHSFSGTLDAARRTLDLGFLIGVTGPVTYKNAVSRREMIAGIPLDALLIETDAPYLAPDPHRGQRNEPAYVAHIADKIAAIQSRTPEEVAAVTADNAARLFSWGETA